MVLRASYNGDAIGLFNGLIVCYLILLWLTIDPLLIRIKLAFGCLRRFIQPVQFFLRLLSNSTKKELIVARSIISAGWLYGCPLIVLFNLNYKVQTYIIEYLLLVAGNYSLPVGYPLDGDDNHCYLRTLIDYLRIEQRELEKQED